MARTVDQIQADIDAVQAQASTGDTMVRAADGSEVQLRSEGDRQRALQSLRGELAQATASGAGASRVRTLLVTPNTGY